MYFNFPPPELVNLAAANDARTLERRLTAFAASTYKPVTRDIEEALLQAVLAGADEAISPLILYGARRWVCPMMF